MAVEAIENSPALGRRNAWPGVGNRERCMPIGAIYRNIYRAPGWRIADCIVDEVTEQHAQRIGISGNVDRVATRQSKIDILRFRDRRELRDRIASDITQIHRCER